PKDTVHIVRTIFVYSNSLYQRIALRNYANHAVSLTLSLVFDNDFADVFEVRGLRRPRRGKIERLVAGEARTLLTYQGLDGKLRQTNIGVAPQPSELLETAATYQLALAAKEARSLFCCVSCGNPELPQMVGFNQGARAIYRRQHSVPHRATTIA